MIPDDSLQLFEDYGVLILPALTIAEQIGIPLPAVPGLLAVGALAARGRISIPLLLGAISVAALAADFAWYELGRRRGPKVLMKLCQLSFEPDAWRRRAETIFARHGARCLLAAKFVPGLTTITPPVAGAFALGRLRFALYDLAGVLLWAGTWLALGYFFSDAIVVIAAGANALGRVFGLVVVTVLIGYIVTSYGRRLLWLRRHGARGVSPELLERRRDGREDAAIIDVRTPLKVTVTPYVIPKIHWLATAVPRCAHERIVAFTAGAPYAASSYDAASVRLILRLRRRGIVLRGRPKGFPLGGLSSRWRPSQLRSACGPRMP